MRHVLPERLIEVAALFLKLGVIGFGGPAAHIAIMHDEVVQRRNWMSDQEFLDLVGATNLIPGPNSTEMAIHIGFQRAGWLGLIIGGACFIAPPMFAVLLLAMLYVRYGSMVQAKWLLYGVKPVVISIILQALWNLGRKAVKGPLTATTGVGVLTLYFLGFNEIALLFASALMVMVVSNFHRVGKKLRTVVLLPLSGVSTPAVFSAFFSHVACAWWSLYGASGSAILK